MADDILYYYFNAKKCIYANGYYPEIFIQEEISIDKITIQQYYREYAWVVLSSGLSEKVVSKVFVKISSIFYNWIDFYEISNNEELVKKDALKIFNNSHKVDALVRMADYLCGTTIQREIQNINEFGIQYLKKFKFIGPATVYHFAKNIGLNYAKPDRHLIRIANLFGYSCPNVFCEDISSQSGEKRAIVDLVLWRYATLEKGYLKKEVYA